MELPILRKNFDIRLSVTKISALFYHLLPHQALIVYSVRAPFYLKRKKLNMKALIELFFTIFRARNWQKTRYIDYNNSGIYVFDSTLLENPHKKIF